MSEACKYHCNDTGPKGKTGHNSSDGMGMSDRINKFG